MLYAGTSSGFLSSKNFSLISVAVMQSVSSVDPAIVDVPDGQCRQRSMERSNPQSTLWYEPMGTSIWVTVEGAVRP